MNETTILKSQTLTLNEYQEKAFTTAVYPEAGTGSLNAIMYGALAVCGEAGEIANKVKKILRDDNGVLTESRRMAIVKECEDLLWELSAHIKELGVTLGLAGQMNLDWLQERVQRNTIKGEGDNR